MHLKNPGMRKKHPEGADSAEKALCGPLQKAQPTRRVMGLWQLMWDLLAASTIFLAVAHSGATAAQNPPTVVVPCNSYPGGWHSGLPPLPFPRSPNGYVNLSLILPVKSFLTRNASQ